MAQTKIEWTWRRWPLSALSMSQLQLALDFGAVQHGEGITLPGYTFNPWIGCRRVSPGCEHCYAEAMDLRRFSKTLGGATKDAPVIHWGKGAPRHRTSESNWSLPLRWNANAKALGVRLRVFCASLADWLDDEVPVEWLADLLCLIASTQALDWLLLTKRPQLWRARLEAILDSQVADTEAKLLARAWLAGVTPSNIWLGTTVEDQKRADERIPTLIAIPATVRFLSCEPLLGPVDLRLHDYAISSEAHSVRRTFIHWVICGGESGEDVKTPAGDIVSAIRPLHPDWARSLRDQCKSAGVAYFFKQWGEWAPCHDATASPEHNFQDGERMFRVGKSAAGNRLDGREHADTPDRAEVLR